MRLAKIVTLCAFQVFLIPNSINRSVRVVIHSDAVSAMATIFRDAVKIGDLAVGDVVNVGQLQLLSLGVVESFKPRPFGTHSSYDPRFIRRKPFLNVVEVIPVIGRTNNEVFELHSSHNRLAYFYVSSRDSSIIDNADSENIAVFIQRGLEEQQSPFSVYHSLSIQQRGLRCCAGSNSLLPYRKPRKTAYEYQRPISPFNSRMGFWRFLCGGLCICLAYGIINYRQG